MSDNSKWDHKDEWRRRGKNFSVLVSRHTALADRETGPNRWCIYAYLYPMHPHFSVFDGHSIYQHAAEIMPLHCGASMVDFPMRNGKITAIQVGCDYHHLYDDVYSFIETKEDACQVFEDADTLFDWLQERNA